MRDPTHKEYDSWDLRLAAAYHIYLDFMRGSIPIYWDESDRVRFSVKTGVSKSKRVLDLKDHAESKKDPITQAGKYHYVVPETIDGGPLPTYEEWAAEKAAKQGAGDRRPE